MLELCNPFTFAILIASMNIFLIWLENKINKTTKEKKEYFRLFSFIFFTSLVTLFLYDSVVVKKNDIEIFTGNPNF